MALASRTALPSDAQIISSIVCQQKIYHFSFVFFPEPIDFGGCKFSGTVRGADRRWEGTRGGRAEPRAA